MAYARKALPTALALLTLAATPSDAPVLVVGNTSYSAVDVQRWLEVTPLAERGAIATRNVVQLNSLIEDHFVPHALLLEHASAELDADADFQRVRDGALAENLSRDLEQAAVIHDEQIAKFYAEHIERYVSPEAIHIWRILVTDEPTARSIISKVKGKRLGVYEWGNLARKHSKDKATNQRDGDLGFVRADGSTDVPQVRVPPHLHAAASSVRNGQLVENPVPERDQFAVIWRRGTRPERALSLESQRDNIRTILARDAAQRARNELLQGLRQQHLTTHTPEAVEAWSYPTSGATSARHGRTLNPHAPARPPQPEQTDRGQR